MSLISSIIPFFEKNSKTFLEWEYMIVTILYGKLFSEKVYNLKKEGI